MLNNSKLFFFLSFALVFLSLADKQCVHRVYLLFTYAYQQFSCCCVAVCVCVLSAVVSLMLVASLYFFFFYFSIPLLFYFTSFYSVLFIFTGSLQCAGTKSCERWLVTASSAWFYLNPHIIIYIFLFSSLLYLYSHGLRTQCFCECDAMLGATQNRQKNIFIYKSEDKNRTE